MAGDHDWYGWLLQYGLLSPDHHPVLRYISAACFAFGIFFLLPVAILILFDIGLWIWRLYWSPPARPRLGALAETTPASTPGGRSGQVANAALNVVEKRAARRQPSARTAEAGS